MAVSSTSGRKFTIERICELAYKKAGLMSLQQGTSDQSWPAKLEYAKDMLQVGLNSMLAYGVQARLGGFSEITVSAGDVTAETYKLTVPEDVADIMTPAVWIADGEDTERATTEKQVEVISREHWQRLASKSATGQPTLLYPHREFDILQAWLWPIPDAEGTLRLNVQRKLADTVESTATLDVEDYWMEYLLAFLARCVGEASSLPAQAVLALRGEEERLLGYSRAKSSQRAGARIRYSHRTGFTR